MLKRWTRISLVVLGLVALIALAHRMADSAATRQLEEALARLDAAVRADEVTEAKSDETSPLFEGLARAIDACETALGPDRFQLMIRVDDGNDPTSIEDLGSTVADSSTAFDLLDAALASAMGRLPASVDYDKLEFGDIVNLARMCTADVRVRLSTNEFDAAARSVSRISALADALENGPSLISQLVRFTLNGKACHTARSLLEQAPNPAALPEILPKSPAGALRVAWSGEARRLHDLIAKALRNDDDLAELIADPSKQSANLDISTTFIEPWIKSGLVELTEHLLRVRDHLEPTRAAIARLEAIEDEMRTDGNRLIRNLGIYWAPSLTSEVECCAEITVLRAGAMAWAQFRERGAWPATESFGNEVVATRVDGDLELRSAVDPSVTWKLVAPRQSEEARAR